MNAEIQIFDDIFVHNVPMGTFANRNHYAAYLVIAIALGIGILLGEPLQNQSSNRGIKQTVIRALELIMSYKAPLRRMLVCMVIALVLTRSRMGNTSFFISLLVAIGAFILITKSRRKPLIAFLVSMLVIDLLVVGGWIGLDRVADRIQGTYLTEQEKKLAQTNLEKSETLEARLKPAMASLRIVEHYPIFGSGGGSFAVQYTIHGEPLPPGYYMPAAHNDYVEILVDTGPPGILLLATVFLGGMVCAIRTMTNKHLKTRRRALGTSILMVGIAQAMHAVVEFNLQIPAMAATLTLVLTLSWCNFVTSRHHKEEH